MDYDGTYSDAYLVDTATGSRPRIIDRLTGGRGGRGGGFGGPLNWSPDGTHAVFYRDRNWHAITVPGGVVTNLTGGLGAAFFNEDHDSPSAPSSYGAGGWTNDSKWILLYDHYDVWQVSSDGQTARNLMDGAGRRERIRFRVLRLDQNQDEEDARGHDPAKPLLLTAEHLETRESGFYRDRVSGASPPEKLLMGPRAYRVAGKAADADVVLLTATTFADPPDLHVTDSNFRAPRKVTDAFPQKSQIAWGMAGELVRYRTADGHPLQAALFKPEGFDPSKKYPLLVYIYERLSQGVHNFTQPGPGTSINAAYYASNGYLVLLPDIAYKIGWPGQSALKCVLPAIQAVVDRGYVNESAIGIQGHSWGGYQIAYMVTQTHRFRAAVAGAPVGNMTSAYSGIRWGTGLPRQFQYEKTQSRIGGTLWQYPLRFLENSPVFMADRVTTPLLILHNEG
ncbi:MAG: prolyl oligopeptidase family serine peptidase [Bryobacteraceae bacterium]